MSVSLRVVIWTPPTFSFSLSRGVTAVPPCCCAMPSFRSSSSFLRCSSSARVPRTLSRMATRASKHASLALSHSSSGLVEEVASKACASASLVLLLPSLVLLVLLPSVLAEISVVCSVRFLRAISGVSDGCGEKGGMGRKVGM